MELTVELIVLIVSLGVGALITAARTALASVDPGVIEARANAGDARARAVKSLLDLPLRTQVPISILNTTALILLAAAGGLYATRQGSDLLGTLNTILTEMLILFALKGLGGILGLAYANPLALAVARPLAFLVALSSPLNALGGWIAGRLRPKLPTHSDDRVTGEEIQITVMEGKEPRVLDEIAPAERQMIAGIIELKDTWASEIMVPRIEVVAVEVSQPLDQVLEVAIQHGHSRLPVYEGSIDHVVGMLHVKDLLPHLRSGKRALTLREVMRPPHFVPESARVSDLFHDLQKRRVHMAVVVDEYGGTAGVVTIEDVLEEIVGEIRDEYDAQEEAPIERVSDTVALFSARVPVGEVNETLGLHLPEEESDTLGGLVYNRIGRMPKLGDQVQVEEALLTVTAAVGRQIRRVRAEKVAPVHSGSPEDTSAETKVGV